MFPGNSDVFFFVGSKKMSLPWNFSFILQIIASLRIISIRTGPAVTIIKIQYIDFADDENNQN